MSLEDSRHTLPCDLCNGTGKAYYGTTYEVICPQCEGEGFVIEDEEEKS